MSGIEEGEDMHARREFVTAMHIVPATLAELNNNSVRSSPNLPLLLPNPGV